MTPTPRWVPEAAAHLINWDLLGPSSAFSSSCHFVQTQNWIVGCCFDWSEILNGVHCGSFPTQSPVEQDGTTEVTQRIQTWPTLRKWLICPHLIMYEFKNKSLLWILIIMNPRPSHWTMLFLHLDSDIPLKLSASTRPVLVTSRCPPCYNSTAVKTSLVCMESTIH